MTLGGVTDQKLHMESRFTYDGMVLKDLCFSDAYFWTGRISIFLY